jgi:hypothetical protein
MCIIYGRICVDLLYLELLWQGMIIKNSLIFQFITINFTLIIFLIHRIQHALFILSVDLEPLFLFHKLLLFEYLLN